jgi:hypothetical protein
MHADYTTKKFVEWADITWIATEEFDSAKNQMDQKDAYNSSSSLLI